MQGPAPGAQAFAALSLPELEEAGGELMRRIAVALRALGEAGADHVPPGERPGGGAPRLRAARLAALLELAAAALAAAEAAPPGVEGAAADPPPAEHDRHAGAPQPAGGGAASVAQPVGEPAARPREARAEAQARALAAGVMYAAPTVDALLARIEQDRRLLASLARAAEARLAERHPTPLGAIELRALVAEMAIAEPARTAQALEHALAAQREAERAAAEAAGEAGAGAEAEAGRG